MDDISIYFNLPHPGARAEQETRALSPSISTTRRKRLKSMSLTLEPQALYICLTQLLVPGFHWGLYFTDEHGVATRHEWAEVKGARDPTSPVEAYGVTVIDPVCESDQENRFNLAFIKVRDYIPNTLNVRELFAGSRVWAGPVGRLVQREEGAEGCMVRNMEQWRQ